MEKHYTVQQAAEATGIKPYVLRYWEEELNICIARNELGHRYYTEYDIQLFLNIKELKNRGLKLSAIKELIPKIAQNAPGFERNKVKLIETEEREQEVPVKETEHNDKILEFQKILERLIRQEMQMKNEGEIRCRSIDEAIRRQQMVRREAAAASEKREKKKYKIHK